MIYQHLNAKFLNTYYLKSEVEKKSELKEKTQRKNLRIGKNFTERKKLKTQAKKLKNQGKAPQNLSKNSKNSQSRA